MPVLARDLMHRDVITVSPELSLVDVHRLFLEEEISGAPVVDDSSSVVGVISSSDLIRMVEEEHDTRRAEPTYFREFLPYSGPDWANDVEDFQDRLGGLQVSDAMTKNVIHVAPDASISAVAKVLRDHRVHRVLVVKRDRLEGIISSFDFVELFA